MIRRSSEPTLPPPGPTKPMTPLTSHTSGSKTRQAFLSQHDDLLDEPDLESTEETPLHLHELDSSPYSTFQSFFHCPEPQRPTKIFTHNILWGEFPEEVKKLIIEDNKKVKVVNPKQNSTFVYPRLKPSSVLDQPNAQPQQVHFHDKFFT